MGKNGNKNILYWSFLVAPTLGTTAIDVSQCWCEGKGALWMVRSTWWPGCLQFYHPHLFLLNIFLHAGKGKRAKKQTSNLIRPLSSEYLWGIFNNETEFDTSPFTPFLELFVDWVNEGKCTRLTVWQCEWGGVSQEVAASVPPWSLFLPSGPRPDLARWWGTSPIKAAHCDKAISFPSASL